MSEDLSNLTLVELLELLEPLHEPPPVPLWPQTAGWIWLALFLLALCVWLLRRWVRKRRAAAYRRAALREIAVAGDDPAALAEILRRTALSAFPRAEVAGLYGEDWLAFLDSTYGGTAFREGPGRVLATTPYSRTTGAENLQAPSADWVRRHHRSTPVPA